MDLQGIYIESNKVIKVYKGLTVKEGIIIVRNKRVAYGRIHINIIHGGL